MSQVISPPLTNPSSRATSVSASVSQSNQTYDEMVANLDIPMSNALEFDEIFNFSDMESGAGSTNSHSQSPATNIPHTPSPNHSSSNLPGVYQWEEPAPYMPYSMMGSLPQEHVQVKQEPVEFAYTSGSQSPALMQPQPQPQVQVVAQTQPTNLPTEPAFPMTNMSPEQQLALQQLMMNLMSLGYNQMAQPQPQQQPQPQPQQQVLQPTTIQPSMIFHASPPAASTSSSSNISPAVSQHISPAVSTHQTQLSPEVETQPSLSRRDSGSSSGRGSHSPPLRSIRQDSSFGLGDDVESKIDNLTPLPAILSTGRGKGGKKGGGLSSVVRQEDEDIDDDDAWRPSPEEYKKLSSKEKRQLRNKLSARAFRTRRKDYIGTLEAHIKDRDTVIDAIRAELMHSRSENNDLRRELEALKASTMNILHPESANTVSQSPAMMNAISVNHAAPVAGPSRQTQNHTPIFNPRKDLSFDAKPFYGANDFLGGGSTICHPLFTPDVVLADDQLPTFKNLPRTNLNPLLNDSKDAVRGPSLAAAKDGKDMSTTFDEWADANPFSLRTMDNYRMQMWTRLAREAAAEKSNVPIELRPKFFVEPKAPVATSTSSSTAEASTSSAGSSTASLISVASNHLSNRLSTSIWAAFQGSSNRVEGDKLAALVTGTARLQGVAQALREDAGVDAGAGVNEKDRIRKTASQVEDTDSLTNLLGGLKLQSGSGGPVGGTGAGVGAERRVENGARANPLGALTQFLSSAMPTRA